MRTPTAFMAMVAALILAACSSPMPSPSASPITPENASCEQPSQVTENGISVQIVLTCQPAVTAAMTALENGKLDLEQIEFHYGSYCPPGARWGPPHDIAHEGYVIFDFADQLPDFMVSVRADDAGVVSLTSGLEPLPTNPIIN